MLTVTRVPIESLHFDPSNARKHDRQNLDAIKGSLAKFGQVEPLVVQASTRVVIGGNGRLEAMKELGWTEVDVHIRDLSPTEATALALALNRTAELAEWDDAALAQQLEALKLEDVPIETFGFDAFFDQTPPPTPRPDAQGAKEINQLELKFTHCCPRCGFEYNETVKRVESSDDGTTTA